MLNNGQHSEHSAARDGAGNSAHAKDAREQERLARTVNGCGLLLRRRVRILHICKRAGEKPEEIKVRKYG